MGPRYPFATLLFAEPSFVSGMGSAIDLGGTAVSFNVSKTETAADLAALRSDLLAVGDDMRRAIDERMAGFRKAEIAG